MARINLLPWREELRRERQAQFVRSALITAVLGVVLVFLVGMIFDQRIQHQEEHGCYQCRADELRLSIPAQFLAPGQ